MFCPSHAAPFCSVFCMWKAPGMLSRSLCQGQRLMQQCSLNCCSFSNFVSCLKRKKIFKISSAACKELVYIQPKQSAIIRAAFLKEFRVQQESMVTAILAVLFTISSYAVLYFLAQQCRYKNEWQRKQSRLRPSV